MYVVNGLGIALLGHGDLIKWKKARDACRSPEVALGGPLLDYDHVDLVKGVGYTSDKWPGRSLAWSW